VVTMARATCSFVLQGSETIERGRIKATRFVFPAGEVTISPVWTPRVALKVSLAKALILLAAGLRGH
jgi:hypothetical protein